MLLSEWLVCKGLQSPTVCILSIMPIRTILLISSNSSNLSQSSQQMLIKIIKHSTLDYKVTLIKIQTWEDHCFLSSFNKLMKINQICNTQISSMCHTYTFTIWKDRLSPFEVNYTQFSSCRWGFKKTSIIHI